MPSNGWGVDRRRLYSLERLEAVDRGETLHLDGSHASR